MQLMAFPRGSRTGLPISSLDSETTTRATGPIFLFAHVCSQTYFRFPGDGDRNGHHANDDLTASGSSYNNGVINGINRIGLGGYGLGGYGGGIGLGQQIRVSEIRQVITFLSSSL